jgi:hypothetical protein
MLTIRRIDPTQVESEEGDLTRMEWLAFCRDRGLVAFAAERGEELVGLAAAESDAKVVHVAILEGDTGTCHALLDRLVRLAGERDMSGWVPLGRPDVRRLILRLGFAPVASADIDGVPSCLYYWSRNADL